MDIDRIEELITLLQHKKQIILQGPPGTGKTFTAKNLAEQLIFGTISPDKTIQSKKLATSDQFALVQFHPAYSYEDFIRGISAKDIDGSIIYETENKLLASFAEKALHNYQAAHQDPQELSKAERISNLIHRFSDSIQIYIDEYGPYEITKAVAIVDVEEDAFRYSGRWQASLRMKFKDLVLAQLKGVQSRQALKNLSGISGLAKQHASYFFKVLHRFQEDFKMDLAATNLEPIPRPEQKPYILIIDEINRANLPAVLGELIYALEYRNEEVASIYAIDGDPKIQLPENLFIIGTMNSADRSVGHLDYAIKRRFAFVDITPDIEVIKTAQAQALFKQVNTLFVQEEAGKKMNAPFLAPDFDFKDVQLGHSYFMIEEAETEQMDCALQLRLQYEIVPLLNEYIKDGILLEIAKPEIEKIAAFGN